MSTIEVLKCCNQCKVEKPLEYFCAQKHGKFGRRGMCKACFKHKFKTQYKANLVKDHRQQYQDNRENCLISAKKWRDNNQDKLNSPEFKEAQKKLQRKRYLEQREIIAAKMRENYQQNKEKFLERSRQYRMSVVQTEEQKEARKKYMKAYYEENKEKSFEYAVRRKRTIDKQTPSWANLAEIRKVYKDCINRNKTAGRAAFHVDHIIPLRGKYVSGLHVETNLQVIPALNNLKKGTSHVLGHQ
jgi:hypothetical protein